MLEIGMQLPHFILRWAVGAEQVFSLQFKDSDGDPIAWDPSDVVRFVINGAELDSVLTVGGFATWTFTGAESVAAYLGKSARLEFISAGETFLWGSGRVKAA